MKGLKTVYVCSECEYKSPKWMGKCPHCGSWNSFVEDVINDEMKTKQAKYTAVTASSDAVLYANLEMPSYIRSSTNIKELDRVLGGGIVDSSVVLIAGEPGIGKSTLLMQICAALSDDNTVLYVSGEESGSQLKYRAKRLGLEDSRENKLYILTETVLDNVIAQIEKISPSFIIIDSIQTMYSADVSSSPGSITQVKESAMRLIELAKSKGISVLLVGHVNKEGSIAGPKVLEHMVDAVLSFEGDREQIYRIIRSTKNRFGSTNEIGVFEMMDYGLREVENPSEMLLAGRPTNISGNCAVCVVEGSRPIITEIQALAGKTVYPAPKRTSNGIDYNRLYMLLAVLEKRLGLRFSQNDVYINVVGGLRFEEPAADLALACALISSIKDVPCDDEMIAIGEIGLAGECRAVNGIEIMVGEAIRLGFTKILVPYRNYEKMKKSKFDAEIIPIRGIYEISAMLDAKKH